MATSGFASTKTCEQTAMATLVAATGGYVSAATVGAVSAKQTTAVATSAAAEKSMATVAGNSLIFSADQANSQDRKENRDPKHKCAIHRRFLQV